MSYSGTVRCGQCYNKGHNKRSCPELRKMAAANPNSYAARQVAGFAAQSAKPRKCSYCGKAEGHTRRTCPTIKTHKREAKQDTTLIRRGLKKWLEATGIGPGALITSRRSFYARGYQDGRSPDQQPRVFLVTETSLSQITQQHGLPGNRADQSFLRATDVASGSQVWFGLPHIPTVAPATGYCGGLSYEQSRLDSDGHQWTVGSPAPGALVEDKDWFGLPLTDMVDRWFASDEKNVSSYFDTISPEQRKAIREYIRSPEALPSEWAQTDPNNTNNG